jgi:hypothetical protein
MKEVSPEVVKGTGLPAGLTSKTMISQACTILTQWLLSPNDPDYPAYAGELVELKEMLNTQKP